MPTTPTRSSPRSSSCAPTAPSCSDFRPTPTGGCRTRWPRRRTGDGPDDARLAGGRRAGEGGGRRPTDASPRKHGVKAAIEPWDYRYYQEKVRKARYDLSQEELKPYFELDNMVHGMFWMAGELYGYEFKEITGTVPVFHPDVRTFEVTNRSDGKLGRPVVLRHLRPARQALGRVAFGLPRRASGCSATRSCSTRNNNNFTKPAAGQPVLISLDDAQTLFHEFGHALHYLTVDVNYPTFAGAQRDFVEYPEPGERELAADARRCSTASPSTTRRASRCRRRWSTRSRRRRPSTRASRRSNICRRRWST